MGLYPINTHRSSLALSYNNSNLYSWRSYACHLILFFVIGTQLVFYVKRCPSLQLMTDICKCRQTRLRDSFPSGLCTEMMSTILYYTALPHNRYLTLHCYFPERSQSLPDQQRRRFRDLLNIIVKCHLCLEK